MTHNNFSNIILVNYFFMVFLVIFFYYVLGGSSFPDYAAYQNIAYKNFGGENWYFTEFLSRYILYKDIFSNFNRVDLLVLFVQIIFILITSVIIFKHNDSLYIVLVFVAFFGPLLLTTVLRASPL